MVCGLPWFVLKTENVSSLIDWFNRRLNLQWHCRPSCSTHLDKFNTDRCTWQSHQQKIHPCRHCTYRPIVRVLMHNIVKISLCLWLFRNCQNLSKTCKLHEIQLHIVDQGSFQHHSRAWCIVQPAAHSAFWQNVRGSINSWEPVGLIIYWTEWLQITIWFS